MKIYKYGPNKKFVKTALRLSWPVIRLAKKCSNLPILKWFINPFFAYPYNEVTYVPIHTEVEAPETISIPHRLVRRVLDLAEDIFIVDECLCRGKTNCSQYPQNVGCIALGRAVNRMHPSHGRKATLQEAYEHVQKAADAGLIASIAHVWIDPLAFGLPDFNKLMFICFCDDCCCLYRTDLKNRGPNLDKACKGVPGLSVIADHSLCTGCGICAANCFLQAITVDSGKAVIGEECRSCGRCVEKCPQKALKLNLQEEEELFQRIKQRIENVADIT